MIWILLLDVQDIEEDLALVKRVRAGDLSGTVTLEEARRRSRGIMYTVILGERAEAELDELPEDVSRGLLRTFGRLANWPDHGCNVRKLSGPFDGLWRVGVGEYRARFDVDTKVKRITITRAGSRQVITGRQGGVSRGGKPLVQAQQGMNHDPLRR